MGEFVCWNGEVDQVCRDEYVRDPDWTTLDDDGSGDDQDESTFGPESVCLPEALSCAFSPECMECAEEDDSESEDECIVHGNGCGNISEALCCSYGKSAACLENTELNTYAGECTVAASGTITAVVVS